MYAALHHDASRSIVDEAYILEALIIICMAFLDPPAAGLCCAQRCRMVVLPFGTMQCASWVMSMCWCVIP
jgi:hypothetical protein